MQIHSLGGDSYSDLNKTEYINQMNLSVGDPLSNIKR